MALPLIAAGIAARAVGKKLASRAAGGITGKGAKQVNPVYRNTGVSKAEAKANARGLKAANKPLSKGNKKLVENIGQKANYIAMDRKPTPPSIKKIYETNQNFGPFKAPEQVQAGMKAVYKEAKKIAMEETRRNSMVPKKISPAQKALNQKLKRGK
jgi:hypothetical protein